MKSIIGYIKTHYLISIIGAIVIIALGSFGYVKYNSAPKYQTVTPSYQKIVQGVSVTGKVKPSANADLAFERSGTVSNVYSDVGSQVNAGDLIVSLQSADLTADLAQAQAQLLKEQVKLTNLKAGNRPEDISISQAQLDNAKAVVAAANSSTINAISDAYSKADDAIRYHTDKFFNNPRTAAPTLIFSVGDASLANSLQNTRADLENVLANFSTQTQTLTVADDVTSIANSSVVWLNKIKSFLDSLSGGVNFLSNNSSLSQTVIDGYKVDMSAARGDISAAISEVTSAVNVRNNALSSLATAQSQFDLQKAGNTQSDIDAQAAQVQTQLSLVAIKQAALSKNFLRSPITGVVSRQDAKVGQIAPAGVVLVSVISNSQFQIEANIPEASISKVKIGDLAKVSLDAYQDGTSFDASIIRIDPAETIVDGVPTYKITFEFSKTDDRIRSGMTANIDIVSASKENALIVPQRVVLSDENGNYVKVLQNGNIVVVRVQTGIRGSDGNIEIIQGLSGGETVIVNSI